MFRLVLANNKEPSWFSQAYYIKTRFNLSLREIMKIMTSLKKDKLIVIQPVSNGIHLNSHLELCYFKLKELFHASLTEVSPISLVPADKYEMYVCDWCRGYKIFISNDIRNKI